MGIIFFRLNGDCSKESLHLAIVIAVACPTLSAILKIAPVNYNIQHDR
ncbi:MAG: hypothetical protein MUE54_08550 [Anaerolineae bacterium]|nr:hypothetical protein [Anaerolineae bacterium]